MHDFDGVYGDGTVGDSEHDRTISKNDKLNYKLILQGLLNEAYHSMGSLQSLQPKVDALVTSINFSIEGLPFREKIAEAKEMLEADKEKYIEDELKKISDDHPYYHPKKICELTRLDKYRLTYKSNYRYYCRLLESLVNLLATHQGLTAPRSFVAQGSEFRID